MLWSWGAFCIDLCPHGFRFLSLLLHGQVQANLTITEEWIASKSGLRAGTHGIHSQSSRTWCPAVDAGEAPSFLVHGALDDAVAPSALWCPSTRGICWFLVYCSPCKLALQPCCLPPLGSCTLSAFPQSPSVHSLLLVPFSLPCMHFLCTLWHSFALITRLVFVFYKHFLLWCLSDWNRCSDF